MFRKLRDWTFRRGDDNKGLPLGTRGECFARKMVERHGLMVLAQNFGIPRGEVDLIAREGDCVVFIEVKTRGNDRYGMPFEAVGPIKQRKIICAAEVFLKRFNPTPPCRFDVISIIQRGQALEGEWIRDAFDAG